MKRTARLWISWADRFGQPPKTIEQLTRDKQRVKEILVRAGCEHLFNEERGLELEVEVDSEQFGILIQELQRDPHLVPPGGLYIWQSHSRPALESAELLIWGPTNQMIEDDYYDLRVDGYQGGPRSSNSRCLSCGTRLEQTRDLIVNKRSMRGKDTSLTYGYQVIVSDQMARLWQEHGLTGIELRPVQHYRKAYQGEPALYQLVVTNTLPPMATPPTEFEGLRHCDVCGRTSGYLKHTHLWGKIEYREDTEAYYPRRVVETSKDFNLTAEYFGELRVAHPMIIVTQRVYRLLRKHKIKHWAAVPVHLAE